jgi:hypothetical protein
MKIPDRYAAVMPIASYGSERAFHPERASDYWYFHNEKRASLSPRHDDLLAFLKHGVETRGGEFKISTFPDEGHNAWDKAWREEAVWEWAFSKRAKNLDKQWTLTPRPPNEQDPIVEGFAAKLAAGEVVTASVGGGPSARLSETAAPKVSAPAALSETDHGTERMFDGLKATYYATTNAVPSSDWITLEYPEPVSGAFTITSGTPDGKMLVSLGAAEVSSDGVNWRQAAIFRSDGVCRFTRQEQFQFLRFRHSFSAPRQIAIRGVSRE